MKTKVQQKSNPNFCEEAGEYLEANGYEREDARFFTNSIYFMRGGIGVIIYNNKAEFMCRHDGDDDRKEGYSQFAAFEGISQLELFDWMLLFHITGIVTLKSFVKNVKEQCPEEGPMAFMNSIMKHFQIADTPKSIPVAY